MKIFNEFLSEQDYQLCLEDLNQRLSAECWQYARSKWENIDSSVLKGVTGSVLSSSVPRHIFDLICNQFASLMDVTEYNEILIYYYLWQPYSGLALHDDSIHRLAATIYLNENWDVDYGGMLIWKEAKDDSIYKAAEPRARTMILNDAKEMHMVSTISPVAPELRKTIQVWFIR